MFQSQFPIPESHYNKYYIIEIINRSAERFSGTYNFNFNFE